MVSVFIYGCGTTSNTVSNPSCSDNSQNQPTEPSCSQGMKNDPAPGNCGSYVDKNNNGVCDLSE